jgi:uncharacterized protein with ATP-grasp and redox domains
VVSLATRVARLTTTDSALQEQILREALFEAAHLDFASPPVGLGRRIQRLVRRRTGARDPFDELKRQSTALALRLLPAVRQRVLAARDPLAAAFSVAIAANALDVGIYPRIDERAIREALIAAANDPIDTAAFAAEAAAARDILYLADNAGEIVFDGLAIDLLGPPRVTLAVRGAPIFNDATLDVARSSGLTDSVVVIDTGSDAAGVIVRECSDEFQRHFASADLILAKGQGNYETLDDVNAPVWFALKVKCEPIARAIGRTIGDLVLWRRPGAINRT